MWWYCNYYQCCYSCYYYYFWNKITYANHGGGSPKSCKFCCCCDCYCLVQETSSVGVVVSTTTTKTPNNDTIRSISVYFDFKLLIYYPHCCHCPFRKIPATDDAITIVVTATTAAAVVVVLELDQYHQNCHHYYDQHPYWLWRSRCGTLQWISCCPPTVINVLVLPLFLLLSLLIVWLLILKDRTQWAAAIWSSSLGLNIDIVF